MIFNKNSFQVDLKNIAELVTTGLVGDCKNFLEAIFDSISKAGFEAVHLNAGDDTW